MKTLIVTFLLLQFVLLVASFPTVSESGLIIHNNSTGTIYFDSTNAAQFDTRGTPGVTYKCETTTGSPHASNVRKSADKLKALPKGTWCKQYNMHRSHCTRMSVTGDAEIGICGDYWGMECVEAGKAAALIADKCMWNGLAGGTVWFDWVSKNRIIVYHS